MIADIKKEKFMIYMERKPYKVSLGKDQSIKVSMERRSFKIVYGKKKALGEVSMKRNALAYGKMTLAGF